MSIEVITMEGTAKFEGDVGPRGLPGPQGEQGIPGAPGSPGRDGADGRDGIDGQDAKINGVNTLTITAGENIHISQAGSTMTISSDMYDDTEVKQDISALENDVDGLDNSKQDKQDEALDTINKIVVNAINEIFASVGGIQGLIPNQASQTNQLADKDFVNSSLNSITAFYITKNAQGDPFATKAELTSATVFYSGGEVRVPTRNDYAFVLADESKTDPITGENPSTRYIFQNNQWEFQFIVNKTSLTANQLAAINSGITSALVALISTNQTNIATIMADYLKSTDKSTTINSSSTNNTIATSKAVYDFIMSLDANNIPY